MKGPKVYFFMPVSTDLEHDQAQVKSFYKQFQDFQFPVLVSEPGKLMNQRVNEALSIVKQLILDDSKTLL